MLELLQDEHAGAFSQHEAIAVDVPRTTRCSGIVVAQAQCPIGGKRRAVAMHVGNFRLSREFQRRIDAFDLKGGRSVIRLARLGIRKHAFRERARRAGDANQCSHKQSKYQPHATAPRHDVGRNCRRIPSLSISENLYEFRARKHRLKSRLPRQFVSANAADLKVPQRWRQTRPGPSNRKAALVSWIC